MQTPETIAALIDARAADAAELPYFIGAESGREMNYGELQRSCRRISALLARAGLASGDTVSVVMPNGRQTVRVLLGAMYGGWCVNPVNLLSQPEQMLYVLEHSDCKLIVVAPDWMERVQALLRRMDRKVQLIAVDPDAEAIEGESEVDSAQSAPTALASAMALLMYTSGTTGKPKGVMLTQSNLCANARAISAEHLLQRDDRVAAVLPLYHINAFAVTLLAPIAHAGALVMPAKFSTAGFWPMVAAHRCTWINVVPTMISYLLEGTPADTPLARSELAAVRFCRSASAALPPEHHRAFEDKFGIGIVETMGFTETVAPAFSNPIDQTLRKIGSVGRASGCEARIVDESGKELPDGETGELVMRGPQVMSGYYKNPEATAGAFFAEGWLRSGDLGRRDADGFFFVTGRIKELIIKGGENIAPREIDEALLRHPAVLDAASVGIPDRHYGQEIMACVILREGERCSEEELRVFCVEHLGRYKTPKLFRFVSDLPRGPSGKVQRLKLIDLASATEPS
ncbi:MAG: AMP-binding protein [Methylibium sp.]|uniref:AMP-binding protein n=1 Tax=Methylibium sp. TaxID=2067992 RepID=UPI00179ED335|nr:AMP-binding protein [Methylibium sp.]MBA3596169.1 AMP-binding protein [Methylibium sp.]